MFLRCQNCPKNIKLTKMSRLSQKVKMSKMSFRYRMFSVFVCFAGYIRDFVSNLCVDSWLDRRSTAFVTQLVNGLTNRCALLGSTCSLASQRQLQSSIPVSGKIRTVIIQLGAMYLMYQVVNLPRRRCTFCLL